MMNDVLANLRRYSAELGGDPEIQPDEASRQRLPIFLAQIYDVAHAHLFDQDSLLFVVKGWEHPTPAEIEKHAQLLAKQFGQNIAFVFSSLPAFDRKRLLKRRIPFIVPHRQFFMPGTMLDIREVHGSSIEPKVRQTLSMPAQLVLLYHIQRRAGDAPFAMQAWASALKYSKMSISRAQRELVSSGLAESSQPGREVNVKFIGNRRELWEKAAPLLRSPVRKEGYFRLPDVALVTLFKAGQSALADYTDLAEGKQRCFAAWQIFLRAQANLEEQPYRDEDTVIIQSWWYPPQVLEQKNTVDRLSLYLSLRQSADERIQSALAKLLDGVPW
jgi:hypothetical protein